MLEHAEFSASGSERWLRCPASHALSKTVPPMAESVYAAEGTQAHACLDFLLKNKKMLAAAAAIARKTYPDDMVDHALSAVDWIMDRLNAARDPVFLSETRIDASDFTCTGQFGTTDAAIVEEFGRLVVIDYKYGAGTTVDVCDDQGRLNSQLAYYALGLSFQYHHNFEEVELVIIQPRAYHESGETVRSVVVPMPELLKWVKTFREGVMATSDPDAPFSSGKWCKFCPAAVVCPQLKDDALRRAQVVFDDARGAIKAPDPQQFKLPHLGRVMDACDALEAWIERVRDHAFHVLKQGGTVEGYKLVDKRSPRRWTFSEVYDLRQKFGTDIYEAPKIKSPAQIEKAFPSAKEWIEKHTTRQSSGVTVVKAADKRPAVRPAAQVFGALPATIDAEFDADIGF